MHPNVELVLSKLPKAVRQRVARMEHGDLQRVVITAAQLALLSQPVTLERGSMDSLSVTMSKYIALMLDDRTVISEISDLEKLVEKHKIGRATAVRQMLTEMRRTLVLPGQPVDQIVDSLRQMRRRGLLEDISPDRKHPRFALVR